MMIIVRVESYKRQSSGSNHRAQNLWSAQAKMGIQLQQLRLEPSQNTGREAN